MTEYIKRLFIYDRFPELKTYILNFYQLHETEILSGYQYPLQGITPEDDINTCMHIKFGGNFTGDELIFDKMLNIFKDTEIELLLNTFNPSVYRSRLFLMPSGHEMTIHRDPSPRIHIPIQTSVGNEFWFWKDTPDWSKICDADSGNIVHKEHMPADGSVYLVDTTKSHTFVNHSNESRIHLVLCKQDSKF